jgi:Primase X
MTSSIQRGNERGRTSHKYSSYHSSENDSVVAEGLDFIVGHFEEPIWPRTIFTHTLGRQLLIYNKQEALARFKQANFIDCRINAYTYLTEYYGINIQAPNFIFIDLDRTSFRSDSTFWLAVNKTCKNIQVLLGGNPTILWTGNGAHIYQPVEGIILELESLFSEFDLPSQAFLKFAAQHLSNHKSDLSNNPSFRSCLVRIPGSHNFKRVQSNNYVADHTTGVNIVRYWNGIRPKINPLIYDFHIWLANNEIKNISKLLRIESSKQYRRTNSFSSDPISWIERLLKTPIDDYRKNAISLILAPYLINVKKITYANAYNIITDWLNGCSSSRRLDSNFKYHTRYALKNAMNKGYVPLKLTTLKNRNTKLYNLILQDLQQ